MTDIPVFLIEGFLDSGKTTFIQQTLEDKQFCKGSRILVLLFEEGEVELDPTTFGSQNVFCEVVDPDSDDLTPDRMIALQKKYKANKVLIECNGMKLLDDLFAFFPENWMIGQQILFFDAETFTIYNSNMRNLVVDKLTGCDMVVFNRVTEDSDLELFHKVVRTTTRQATILYERTTGEITRDDTEDPMPFDVNAPVIEIEDRDFALFYRDLNENPDVYEGKTIKCKVMTVKNAQVKSNEMLIGRHIMTCCAADTKYCPILAKWAKAYDFSTYDWAVITGTVNTERHELYGGKGPVVTILSAEHSTQPEDPVATFY